MENIGYHAPVEYEISDKGKPVETFVPAHQIATAVPHSNVRTKEDIARDILLQKMVGLANLRAKITNDTRLAENARARKGRTKKSRRKRALEKASRKRNR